jgi:hypothetical protein
MTGGTVPERTLIKHEAETPPLETVRVFRPVEPKFALKPEPFGFAIARSGDDHVYVPVPPVAATVATLPNVTFWEAGEHASVPLVAVEAITVRLQVAESPALVTVIG